MPRLDPIKNFDLSILDQLGSLDLSNADQLFDPEQLEKLASSSLGGEEDDQMGINDAQAQGIFGNLE